GGKARAAAADHPRPIPLDRRQVPRQLQDEATEALVGDQQVGARADHADGEVLLIGPAEELHQLLLGLRAGEVVGRAAAADCRHPRQRIVVVDPSRLHRPPSPSATRASASLKMSPAPIVISRSPSPSLGPSARAATSALGSHHTGLPPAWSAAASATIRPLTPSSGPAGSSRAA